jgi:hypothetical protein
MISSYLSSSNPPDRAEKIRETHFLTLANLRTGEIDNPHLTTSTSYTTQMLARLASGSTPVKLTKSMLTMEVVLHGVLTTMDRREADRPANSF